jgi:predicted nucleotidyltransferase
MRPSLALKIHQKEVLDILGASCAINPRVFGSVARGEDSENSDLDLLIDTKPKTTLFDLIGLQLKLEEVLRVKVDLVTEGGLARRIKQNVIDDAVAL